MFPPRDFMSHFNFSWLKLISSKPIKGTEWGMRVPQCSSVGEVWHVCLWIQCFLSPSSISWIEFGKVNKPGEVISNKSDLKTIPAPQYCLKHVQRDPEDALVWGCISLINGVNRRVWLNSNGHQFRILSWPSDWCRIFVKEFVYSNWHSKTTLRTAEWPRQQWLYLTNKTGAHEMATTKSSMNMSATFWTGVEIESSSSWGSRIRYWFLPVPAIL